MGKRESQSFHKEDEIVDGKKQIRQHSDDTDGKNDNMREYYEKVENYLAKPRQEKSEQQKDKEVQDKSNESEQTKDKEVQDEKHESHQPKHKEVQEENLNSELSKEKVV